MEYVQVESAVIDMTLEPISSCCHDGCVKLSACPISGRSVWTLYNMGLAVPGFQLQDLPISSPLSDPA